MTTDDRGSGLPEAAIPLEFIEMFAEDVSGGRIRPVDEYVARFPEWEPEIRLRHAAFSAPRTAGAAEPAPPRHAAANPDFGPYRLIDELGRGGQGVVWLAEDRRLGRRVALKLLHGFGPGNLEAFERFRREAAIAARLRHPGLCAVYEAGFENGVPYIAMQYVEGETLGQRIRSRRDAVSGSGLGTADERPGTAADRSSGRAHASAMAETIEAAARILHDIHEAGIIHRDVKPANFMIDRSGRVILMDFGIARDTATDLETLTGTGDVLGTLPFMSPEQISPEGKTIDRRTDVWSLGASLFQAVSLRLPFEAPTPEALVHAITTREPPRLRKVAPAAHRDLEVIVATALEKDLGRRYRTALDFAEDLRRLRQREPVRARPAGPWLRLRRWVAREPVVAALAAAVILAALGFAAYAWRARERSDKKLREYVQLADLKVAGDLLDAEDGLWPRVRARAPALDAWMGEVRAVLDRTPRHVAALEELRARPAGESEDPAADAWREEKLVELLADLGRLRTLLPRVEARRREIDAIYEATIGSEDARKRWDECLRSLAEHPRFEDTDLEPIEGLLPLGRDARSGLWEFWVAGTGDVPPRSGDPEKGEVTMSDGGGVVLVLVPGGSTMLGSQAEDPDGPNYDEESKPGVDQSREARFEPFLISKFEMTKGQWERLTGSQLGAPLRADASPGLSVTHRHPILGMTALKADEAARRAGLRLPTSDEWEHAARASASTAYWTGQAPDTLEGAENIADASIRLQGLTASGTEEAWDDGYPVASPVGTFRPNRFGLFDVAGNATEWTSSEHAGAARSQPGEDGSPVRGVLRYTRGGTFKFPHRIARSANFELKEPDSTANYLGFRPARSLSTSTR